MRKIYWHIMGRFYEARSNRALYLHHKFAQVKEKFFRLRDRHTNTGAGK